MHARTANVVDLPAAFAVGATSGTIEFPQIYTTAATTTPSTLYKASSLR